MDNYHQGDLTDIVRASAGALGQSDDVSNWEFPSSSSDPIALSSAMEDNRDNVFGDPFCNIRDPLLYELNMAGSSYFSSATTANSADHMLSASVDHDTSSFCGSSSSTNHNNNNNILGHHHKVFEEEMNKGSTSPCNIFSRIQISPNNPTTNKLPVSPCDSPVMAAAATAAASSPRSFKASAMGSSHDMINVTSSKSCLIENTGPVQISSPRNLGIKRRKSQAKKVVCIPAPAAVNSRPSGEVVPSDLWAWRKYGQKPIKGSPYPRGYYRCSSSKGCSARKQVERSRTDPNMLVITYTSEHNHPWPIQRNALAGSTRSQLTKNNTNSNNATAAKKAANTKEELKESSSNDNLSPTATIHVHNAASSSTPAPVKEEIDEETTENKELELEDNDHSNEFSTAHEGFPQNYRPVMPDQSDQDFFADLGEIEADTLDLLFSQGFTTSTADHDHDDQHKESKAMDPFSIFDWTDQDNNNP